jgi:Fic-DOC domain mobile mystery protein B
VSDIFAEPDEAATPLTPEEQQGLKLAYIATRGELNAAEQENIARGQDWAFARKRNILTEAFIIALHRRMFGDVWRWAGKFRTSARNIGIDHWQIRPELRTLLDDAGAWVANGTYPSDEIAIRLHHRLVLIHPFPNGNGRHARLIADLFIVQLGGKRFSWGSGSLHNPGELRRRYIDALHAADRHDIEALLAFARS